jgi:hypothetical protein
MRLLKKRPASAMDEEQEDKAPLPNLSPNFDWQSAPRVKLGHKGREYVILPKAVAVPVIMRMLELSSTCLLAWPSKSNEVMSFGARYMNLIASFPNSLCLGGAVFHEVPHAEGEELSFVCVGTLNYTPQHIVRKAMLALQTCKEVALFDSVVFAQLEGFFPDEHQHIDGVTQV